ncbi:beta,beta-carotene 15,15'-dioxygenase-like [Oratosquilla oratoria]|uniref:beta,beta-carotene 15,15'-dioxygenase-like n=1 Tax=Oratosquilla oratoria TaxID=337810 RepID=UPI003F76AAFD
MYSKFDPGAMTDNTSSNIMFIEDEVFVATESCFLRKVDPRNLDTGEKVDLMKLVGVNMATSHPLTDKDGTTYNLGGSFISGPKYHIIQVPPCKDTNCNGSDPWTASKVIGTIPSSWKTCFSYHHSFGMTENYLIFLEQPMLINTVKIATSQVKGKSLHDCLDWCPEEKVKFHIINKTTGQLLKTKYISEEAFFLFHHSNAYEVDGQIVVDVVAYDSPEIFDKLYLNKVRMNEYSNRHPPQLRRFVIPIVEGKTVRAGEELVHVPGCEASAIRVKDNRLGDHIRLQCQNIGKPGFEMPSHNPKYTGKHYRYVYGTGGYEQGYFCHSASKTDVETGESWLWKGNEYQYPGEPVFVARPDSTDEDDGVLLVTVVDIRKDHKDMMLVLDAKDLSEIARAEVDVPIPNGLHGLFRLEE